MTTVQGNPNPEQHGADPIGRLLLTPEETADVLCISRAKLFQLLAADEIRSVKIGKLRRIPVSAVRQYVDDLEAAATA